MADEIEQQVEKKDTTADSNAGQTMADFVRSELKLTPPTEEAEKGNAQSLSKTEEEEAAKREELLANESRAEKEAREQRELEEAEAAKLKKEEEDDKKKEGEKEEQQEQEQQEEVKKDPVPYERFEELNTRLKGTNEELEKLRPIAQSHQQIVDYCTQHGIDQQQFSNLLDIQRLLNSDPQAALAKILPIVESLQGFVGDKLPSDLQTKVDTAKMDLADAREMAKLRAQSQFGANRFKQWQNVQQQREIEQGQRQMVTAATEWTQAKLKSNPDFKPKAAPQPGKAENPDGIYEMVFDKFASLAGQRDTQGNNVNPCRNPQELAALLERAYTAVSATLAPLIRKPATRRPLTHTGSGQHNATKSFEQAKTMKEAIAMAVEMHK